MESYYGLWAGWLWWLVTPCVGGGQDCRHHYAPTWMIQQEGGCYRGYYERNCVSVGCHKRRYSKIVGGSTCSYCVTANKLPMRCRALDHNFNNQQWYFLAAYQRLVVCNNLTATNVYGVVLRRMGGCGGWLWVWLLRRGTVLVLVCGITRGELFGITCSYCLTANQCLSWPTLHFHLNCHVHHRRASRKEVGVMIMSKPLRPLRMY
eukprot:TRINITY_DN67875_c5_g1_i1.p1 TRINITY_DN67875_c5_g1~~TRINITY_DN67875_c5_g1_i1.p1  ORF type:complete len:206 (-),score=4.42 TRINITY_DN67875_c5_g1_i1:36-653(-)